jgi:enterochelin esterase-like enzyme
MTILFGNSSKGLSFMKALVFDMIFGIVSSFSPLAVPILVNQGYRRVQTQIGPVLCV